jgi:hypothetical protein
MVLPVSRCTTLLYATSETLYGFCFKWLLVLDFRGPRGQYYSIGKESRGRSGQGMARLSAAAVARAARMGGAQVKCSNDLTIRVGELEGVRRGLSRSSITEAVVDVPSPQARGE